jgi:methylenetetrahydrofolate dehydrogenase (NADP+)/methenyltetrahydrofolate cyclohydrolase
MSATIIDGKSVARAIRQEVRSEIDKLKAEGIKPKLAVILVGEDPASVIYARAKEKACKASDIIYELSKYPQEVHEETIIERIRDLNRDPNCHGIMVELPLPGHINKERIMLSVEPDKDVDGINPINRGRMFTRKDGLFPVTPQSCIEILKRHGITIEGKKVCLIGRGDTVGKPLIFLLLNENATLTVCHTKTQNLEFHTKMADIVVSAAGRAGLVKKDMISPGTIVVDAGINDLDGKTVGDVDFDSVSEVAGAITPVPGGVGSLTTALIQRNLLKAIALQNK